MGLYPGGLKTGWGFKVGFYGICDPPRKKGAYEISRFGRFHNFDREHLKNVWNFREIFCSRREHEVKIIEVIVNHSMHESFEPQFTRETFTN